MIEKYYEEELRYLYESGREFSKAHPDRARYLNIDSLGDRDPYVERLFEGFAFLAGRIREKLDESFPQMPEGFINLLWPQFLQEIPSLAIVRFEPRIGYLQKSETLPVRSEITSGPVGRDSTICRFTTTQPVVLNPVSLDNVTRETDTLNNEIISLIFTLDSSLKWNLFNFRSIRIFFHAELPTALLLHRLFTSAVRKVEVKFGSAGSFYNLDPRKAVAPGGFNIDETLLPTARRAFWGYNLLREYFVFPEKFLFIDLLGIDTLPQPQATPDIITCRVTIKEQLPADRQITASMFKLHCCPVANIFTNTTDPVMKSGLQPEYRVIADSTCKKMQVHSICSVTGIDKATGDQTVYEPFYSFRNIGNKSVNTYSTRFIKNAAGRREMNIALNGPQLKENEIKKETLLIEAWCTNGSMPRDAIHEGDISNPGRGFPNYAQFSNITRPTAPFLPPQHDEYLWMFQAHLAATHTGLASADVLRRFLHLYNWSGMEGKNRRIESIIDVKSEPAQMFYKGSVICGVRFIVTVEEPAFKDTADLHLFGLVLSHFLSQYAQINTFCELQFLLKPSGKLMTWNHIEGKECLI